MKKNVEQSKEYLKTNRRGNILIGIAQGVAGFAIGLIAVVLVAVIVYSLQSSSSVGNSTTVAWQVSNNTLGMLLNFSNQLGLAGTVLGFVVIFGGLALLGVYAYNSYGGKGR